MDHYTGTTALITGASVGIGAAFARALAQRKTHLVLVARSVDKLNALAAELHHQHGIDVAVIAADLSQNGAAEAVYAETVQRGLAVDLLINNAGFGTHGAFETQDLEREHQEIMLNVATLVDLTHLFVPAMLERGRGGVINVASTAGFQPLPYMAVYGATKAFVVSFSEALWGEYRARGLRVLALCPGATATDFFTTVGTTDAAVGRLQTPEQVVATGLRAWERGKSAAVSGWSNYALAQLPRMLPRAWTARIAGRTMRPRVVPT